jgi:hypothetical protein
VDTTTHFKNITTTKAPSNRPTRVNGTGFASVSASALTDATFELSEVDQYILE